MKKELKKIITFIASFKGLTTLALGQIISSAIGGIFWFYIASLVGVTQYGEISYIIAISGIAGTIASLGAGNTIIIYTAKGQKIQRPIFLLTLISSFVISIALFFLLHNLGASFYVIGFVIFGLITSELIGKKLYRDYSKYIITQRVLMVALSIIFYYLMGMFGVILGIALSFFPYSFRVYQVFRDSKVDFSVLREKKHFMINSYLLDLRSIFAGSTDKLIITPLFGFTLLGNYQLGIQFLSILSIIPTIVYQYSIPHDASGNPNKKLKKAIIFVSIGLSILGISLAPLIIPLLFPKFMEAILVIQIVSLAIIPGAINLTYLTKFMGSEKNLILVLGSVIYLSTQILCIIILGKIYGINGIASALVLAATAECIFLILIDKYWIKK